MNFIELERTPTVDEDGAKPRIDTIIVELLLPKFGAHRKHQGM